MASSTRIYSSGGESSAWTAQVELARAARGGGYRVDSGMITSILISPFSRRAFQLSPDDSFLASMLLSAGGRRFELKVAVPRERGVERLSRAKNRVERQRVARLRRKIAGASLYPTCIHLDLRSREVGG